MVPEAIRVINRIQRAWEASPRKHQYAKVERPKDKTGNRTPISWILGSCSTAEPRPARKDMDLKKNSMSVKEREMLESITASEGSEEPETCF